MLTWLSENAMPVLALVISLGTLTITGVSDSSAKATNVDARLTVIERNVEDSLPSITKDVAELQKQSALTTMVLHDLKYAVKELTVSTNELAKVSTVVAVLENKVTHLEAEKARKK